MDCLDLDGRSRVPYTTAVQDFLCIGIFNFADGTQQFKDEEYLPGRLFSPRLSPADLEIFCKENINIYENYFKKYEALIESLDHPEFPSFWVWLVINDAAAVRRSEK